MGFKARFRRGTKVLWLDGRERLGLRPDFVPPTTLIEPVVAGGTSANRYGGSELVGRRAANYDFPFTVQALGASNAECERAIQDLDLFLQAAGDKWEPTYFEWWPDSAVAFEPIWGQFGAFLRLEVVHGSARKLPGYGTASTKERVIQATVALQTRPHALGQRQLLATAGGGILQDRIGLTDGASRGVIVPEATTNKMTNPIFGHSTWNNGWTADADLIVSQNTNPEFLLPGTTSSAKITSRNTGQEFYQFINLGNTNNHAFSCYVKLPDGGVVSSTQVELFYFLGTVTTTYRHVGNGVYLLTGNSTGSASSRNTGIQVKNGYTIYLLGYQVEEKDYVTPLCWGDLMGHAWTGTAHASTSTRTAAELSIPATPKTYNHGNGTIRVVWRPSRASTAGGDSILFAGDTGGLVLQYDTAPGRFELQDFANDANSANMAFAAYDTFVFHAVWDGGAALKLYINGALAATGGAAYTPTSVLPANINIGSTNVPNTHANGTFMDFAIYDRAMTAAEALADYNNIAQVVNDGQQLMPIPGFWTKDADNVTDNCDDSSRDNWGVAFGIPGSAPAVTEFDLTRSFNSTNETVISNIVCDEFLSPDRTVLFDLSGTANANSSGGAYESQAIGGVPCTFYGSSLEDREYLILAGKEVYCLTRAGVTIGAHEFSIGFRFGIGSSAAIISNFRDLIMITGAGATTFRLYRSSPLVLPTAERLFLDSLDLTDALQRYQISIGDTALITCNVDYFAFLPRPLMVLSPRHATGSGTQSILVQGRRAIAYVSGTPEAICDLRGDAIELVPGQLNILVSLHGDSSINPDVTYTMTYNQVHVTPRWVVA